MSTDTNNGGSLVPREPDHNWPVNPMSQLDRVWTSIAADDPEAGQLMLKAMQDADAALGDHLNEPLSVRHVVCHTCDIESQEGGEVIQAIRTVLITADGKAYAAVSQGVFKSLGLIFNVFGPPPWRVPAKLICRQKNTRRGRRIFYLEYIT